MATSETVSEQPMTDAEVLAFGYRGLGGQIDVVPGLNGIWHFEPPSSEPDQASVFWHDRILCLSEEERVKVLAVLGKNPPRGQ